MRRRVHGIHLCWGTYGFWLPNDPRGSGSADVTAPHLRPFGPTTKVEERSRSRARQPHDRELRKAAKLALKRPAVVFDGLQGRAVARGFGEFLVAHGLTVWACAVLPDHVHLVVGPSPIRADELAARLKGAATERLKAEGLHPFGHLADETGDVPKCWQKGEWKVYLFDPAGVRGRIQYVEDNPLKEGKRKQTWSFVVTYSG